MRLPLTLVFAAAALTGCPSSGGAGGSQSAVEAIKARGRLIVGTDAGYVPFEVTEPDGSITGYDVDLVREVAKDLGVEAEIRNTAWTGIIGTLRTGKIDVIFSGMSVTGERQKAVLFSEPYFWIGQVVVKRKGDERIKSWKDLDDPAITVAVQESTTGEMAVRRQMPKAQLLRFPKTDAACLAVVQEKADAVVFDHPYLMEYVKTRTQGELEGLWEPFTSEPIAAAVAPQSKDLKAAIDATLARLEASGELAKLKQKYFGDDAAGLVKGKVDALLADEAPAEAAPQ